MKSLLKSVGMWFYAILYGTMVSLGILKTMITEGFGTVMHVKKREERPACLQDPKLGAHGFLHLEDVKIHYVANGPEDKPLMLFLHGFPEFWFSWRNQLVQFSKDYRCVAIDMRGYGESDKPLGIEPYQMKYLMKDVQQVIEALGHKSCILVAHDWGGAVAWSFARHFPDYVDKLIVMNCPSSPVFAKLLPVDKDQFKKSWYMFFFQLPYLPELMMRSKDLFAFSLLSKGMPKPMPEEELEAYKYTYSQPGAMSPPINYYRAALRLHNPNYDMKYAMPVLLIWGLNDTALSSKLVDIIEKDAPDITVKKMENIGHFIQLEAPDKVEDAMREWLSSQGKK